MERTTAGHVFCIGADKRYSSSASSIVTRRGTSGRVARATASSLRRLSWPLPGSAQGEEHIDSSAERARAATRVADVAAALAFVTEQEDEDVVRCDSLQGTYSRLCYDRVVGVLPDARSQGSLVSTTSRPIS